MMGRRVYRAAYVEGRRGIVQSTHDRALLRKEAFYRSHFVMGRRVHRAAYVEGRRGICV